MVKPTAWSRATIDSTPWVKASMAARAVGRGGQDNVSAGSRNTAVGINASLIMANLSPVSSSRITAPSVHSDPEPEVVGTAINGRHVKLLGFDPISSAESPELRDALNALP